MNEILDKNFALIGDEDTGVGVQCNLECLHTRGGKPVIYYSREDVSPYAADPDVECVSTISGLYRATGDHFTSVHGAVWSLVCGPSPRAYAIEPGPLGISIPQEIIDWADQAARGHGYVGGFSPDESDLYLLVTPADEAGEVGGELDFTTLPMPEGDLTLLRRAVAAAWEQDVHDEP
jgi:hypothetical protein